TRPDPTTCEPTATWAIAVDRGWILAADASSLPDLLSRMTGDPHDADATLAWWQPLAHGDVLGLGIVDLKQAGAAMAQPLVEAAAESLAAGGEGVDHAYLGLGVTPVPPQGRLRLVVDAAEATNVGQRLQAFRKAVDDSRTRWADTMPTVARLYESLDVRAEGP